MADYYPLIARAVAGLEKNTGEGRRVLYERARQALVTQLRGVTPVLSESDVTRERLALEEAIRRVEAESARQSNIRADLLGRVRPPEFPRWEGSDPAAEPEPPLPPPRRAPSVTRADGRPANPTTSARGRGETREDDPVKDGEGHSPEPAVPPPRRPTPRPDARAGTSTPAFRTRSEPRPA